MWKAQNNQFHLTVCYFTVLTYIQYVTYQNLTDTIKTSLKVFPNKKHPLVLLKYTTDDNFNIYEIVL